jgi:hypothetical protein
MACRNDEQEIFYEASKIYWGKEQLREVTFVDDVAGSLNGEWFELNAKALDEAGTETEYYVLLEGSLPPLDPAPAGKTKISVSYSDNDSASTIASLAQVAIDALAGFNATLDSATVLCIENADIGEVTAEDQSNAGSLTFTNYAGKGGYLGRTAEGIEISMETTVGEVRSNQTSNVLLDEIVQGQSASCSAGFIELSKDRLKTIFNGAVGGAFTPAGGTEVVGGGESTISSSLKASGGKLILHPVRLDDADRSRDFIFWQSAPKPESLNYSGTDLQQLNCTFTAYLDDSKNKNVNLYMIGDWKQDI